MAKRKCIICGEWIDSSESSIPYKGRYVHQSCFNIGIAAISLNKKEQLSQKDKKQNTKTTSTTKKQTIKLETPISEQEYQERTEFFEYLKSLLKVECLNVKILTLSKKYNKELNFSWIGMKKALEWFFDVKGNILQEGNDCIGILPYIYDEAQEYYKELENKIKFNSEIDFSNYYQERTVKINPNKHSSKNLIDIDSL